MGDEEWTGWWGDDPPYHHPVFVLTHHPRPAITMQGGTTFDEMHYVISPILLGSGERLFDHLDGGPDGYKCVELVTSTSVIHVRIVRA